MSIAAELHNGVQLHFPDGTPDDHIDATVRRHLGLEPSGIQIDPQALMMFLQAIGAHASTLQNTRQQSKQTMGEKDEQRFQQNVKLHKDSTNAKIGAINSTGQVFGSAVEKLLEPLTHLADGAHLTSEIVRAVDNLTDTIMEVGKSIIAAIQLPKELYNDKDGRPKGLRPTKTVTLKDII